MESEEIKERAVKSTVALIGRTFFLQATNAVAFFLLGVFLDAKAIGIFIIVSAIMRIFGLFTDVGLGASIIQKKEDITETDLKTAFTFQILLVSIVIAGGLILQKQITGFSHLTGGGIFLYQVLLFTLFVSSLKMVPSILLERKLDFEKQVIPQIVEGIVFSVVAVILAYKGFGVYSYAWAVLASSLSGLPLYYLVSPWRIGIKIDMRSLRQLFSFGILFQGKSVLGVIKDDLLTFFLSGLIGPAGLGFWGWAQRWSFFPFRLITDNVTKVAFPAYSRLQSEKEILRNGLEKSLFAISFSLWPVLALMAVLMRPFISLLPQYAKWIPAIPSFYFLIGTAALSALTNLLVNVLDANGQVKTTLGLMVFWIGLTWGATFLFVARFGFTGVAMASFLVSCTFFIVLYLVQKVVRFDFWPAITGPGIACACLILSVYFLGKLVPTSWIGLVALAAIGTIIYLGVVTLVARKKVEHLFALFIKTYRK